jgi:hypothetical protein
MVTHLHIGRKYIISIWIVLNKALSSIVVNFKVAIIIQKVTNKRYNRELHGRIFFHADATPAYLDYGIASLMKETFSPQARKNMKLIAVLREPTGRILSWYNHVKYAVEVEYCPEEGIHFCHRILRKSFISPSASFLGDPLSCLRSKHAEIAQGDDLSEVLTFHEFALTSHKSIHKSKYIDILKEYYEVFGSKNILVLNYDWMMEHQGKTLELISEFVGMDNIWNPESSMPYVNDNAFDGKMSMKDIECDAVDELHISFSLTMRNCTNCYMRMNLGMVSLTFVGSRNLNAKKSKSFIVM